MSRFSRFGNDLYTGRRQIDFVGRRKVWYVVSAVLIAAAAVGLFGRGLNFSLEFRGGSEFKVHGVTSTENYDARATDAVRSATGSNDSVVVTKIGVDDVRVQTEKAGSEQGDVNDKVVQSLAKEFGVKSSEIDSTFIGPSWGETVTKKAIASLLWFLAILSVVLALYFRTWKMAAAALVALLHDVFFTVGFYALTGLEVSPATMISFLTILGYSIYDTVVVFDKVRENTHEAQVTGQRTYGQAANYAVNQTLVRSINTSVVGLLPVASVVVVAATLLGPGTLLDLSVALLIGIAVGTFSSIFIATPMLVDLRRNEPGIKELDKRAKAFQTSRSAGLADEDGGQGEASSGVVDPERASAAAKVRQERTGRRREVHPLARKGD